MTSNVSTSETQAADRRLWIKGSPARVDLSGDVLEQVTVVQKSMASLSTNVTSLQASMDSNVKRLEDAISAFPKPLPAVWTESVMPMARLVLQAQVQALDATPEGSVRRKSGEAGDAKNANDTRMDELRTAAGKYIATMGDTDLQVRCHNALLPFKSPAPAVRLQRFLDMQKLLNELAAHYAQVDAAAQAEADAAENAASNT